MMSPLNTSAPPASLISTLWGTPLSLFAKWITNSAPAGALTWVWSKAVLELADISTVCAFAGTEAEAAALPPAPPLADGLANYDFQQSGYGVAPGSGL